MSVGLPNAGLNTELANEHLAARSPHLFGVIGRIWPRDLNALASIALAFHWVISSEGEAELDFQRTEGVSFNPRPARVGLILINDVQIRDAQSVAAGILATATEDSTLAALGTAAGSALLPPRVVELAEHSRQPAAKLLQDETLQNLALPAQIACALFLDRARQLHRMTAESRISTWEQCFEQRLAYLALAEKHCSPIYTLLKAWERRFSERLLREQTCNLKEA